MCGVYKGGVGVNGEEVAVSNVWRLAMTFEQSPPAEATT
jgi:hypothetical protein